MLLILGCVVSGKNILNGFPGITSSASLPEKSGLSQSFPITLTKGDGEHLKAATHHLQAIDFYVDVECFYTRSARSDLLQRLQGWAHI